MEIYTASEMKEIDRITINDDREKSFELMKIASKGIFTIIDRKIKPNKKENILILAGKGNNGGDALCVGNHLCEQGYKVSFAIVDESDNLEKRSPQMRFFEKELVKKQVAVLEAGSDDFYEAIKKSAWIIDGIFGAGFQGKATGFYKEVILALNGSHAKKIAIDLPSGLNGNNGLTDLAVCCDYTIVVDSYKTGLVFGDGPTYSGQIHVTDPIGLAKEKPCYQKKELLTEDEIPLLKKRKKTGHKYDFGKTIVVGGCKSMTGAPLLAGMAALKSGCGLSVVLNDEKTRAYTMNPWPELIVESYQEESDFLSHFDKCSCVVFGPGMGRNNSHSNLLLALIKRNIPIVLDADGIELLNEIRDQISLEKAKVIITPHYGELARLFRVKSTDVKKDPIYFAKSAAESYQVDVILKGAATIIVDSDSIKIHSGAESALATAGTGDVLSGILAGLIAQGYSKKEALPLAVHLHFLAGCSAAEQKTSWSTTAGDVIDNLNVAIKEIVHRNGTR